VTVLPINQLTVSVQLKGAGFPASLSRCITFELWDCSSMTPRATVNQAMTFVNGLASNISVAIPCGAYTCITARDRLHTLRRTDLDDFAISGLQYVADFTNKAPAGDDDSLIGGNLNTDHVIDILDFGVFVGAYNTSYGTGNTTCSTLPTHADISGNGFVFTEDFTFIQINFLKSNEANCCGAPGVILSAAQTGPPARTSVTVAELKATGQSSLAVADLNGDGVVNQSDIAAWLQGARPGQPVTPPKPGRR
jgi:hypothetical protein